MIKNHHQFYFYFTTKHKFQTWFNQKYKPTNRAKLLTIVAPHLDMRDSKNLSRKIFPFSVQSTAKTVFDKKYMKKKQNSNN